MKFVFYYSLKPGAKAALKRGPGKYRKYAVDIINGKQYIATINKQTERALNWVLVIYGTGKPIKGVT